MNEATDTAPESELPSWGRELKAEVATLKARVKSIEARFGAAAFGGVAVAEVLLRLFERLGG